MVGMSARKVFAFIQVVYLPWKPGRELHGPAPPDHTLRVTIGLKQGRLDELISTLHAVSDPRHERYGAHLTKAQVEDLVAPHPDSLSLVEEWLARHDIDPSTTVTHSGRSSRLPLDASISKIRTHAQHHIQHLLQPVQRHPHRAHHFLAFCTNTSTLHLLRATSLCNSNACISWH